jgi:SepF-like predicted cell division protein (DUF552 family)
MTLTEEIEEIRKEVEEIRNEIREMRKEVRGMILRLKEEEGDYTK